jgi:hypothetical protein
METAIMDSAAKDMRPRTPGQGSPSHNFQSLGAAGAKPDSGARPTSSYLQAGAPNTPPYLLSPPTSGSDYFADMPSTKLEWNENPNTQTPPQHSQQATPSTTPAQL